MFGRFVDWILAAIALIGIVVTGFWAVYGGNQNAAALEDGIERQAKTVLQENGYSWAEIEMDGQHATLSGQSPGDGAGDGAIRLLSASGLFGNRWMGPITGLTDKVIAGAPISPYIWVAEKMRNGGIVLSGYAPDQRTIEALQIDAEAIAPGEVENRIKIGSGQPDGDWLMVAHQALLQLDKLEYGRVELIDQVLRIEGLSMSPIFRTSLRNGLPGIDDNFTLEADVRGAGIWSASLEADEVILHGLVNSESERGEILELVSSSFSGNISDQMVIGEHAHDDWLDGIRRILPQFLRFRSGLVVFDPEGDGYRVSGEAADSAIAFLRDDVASEASFPIVLDVEAVDSDIAEITGLDFESDALASCQTAFGAVLATNRVTFESGKNTIDRSSGATLDKLMGVARRCEGFVFQISGHTDSQGDRGFNISLSRSRAQAVADYMSARGIADDRMDAIGFGPDIPIADNATREGRAANRRIEFKVVEGG